MYSLIANIVLLIHFAFIVFVLVGGFFYPRWPKLACFHIPSVIYAFITQLLPAQFSGWGLCPLTLLEKYFRLFATDIVCPGEFIPHYITKTLFSPELYPYAGLFYASTLIIFNLAAFSALTKTRKVKSVSGQIVNSKAS